MTKSLGDKFYKRKAVVEKVIDKYAAQVKLIDDGIKLKLDQVCIFFQTNKRFNFVTLSIDTVYELRPIYKSLSILEIDLEMAFS